MDGARGDARTREEGFADEKRVTHSLLPILELSDAERNGGDPARVADDDRFLARESLQAEDVFVLLILRFGARFRAHTFGGLDFFLELRAHVEKAFDHLVGESDGIGPVARIGAQQPFDLVGGLVGAPEGDETGSVIRARPLDGRRRLQGVGRGRVQDVLEARHSLGVAARIVLVFGVFELGRVIGARRACRDADREGKGSGMDGAGARH